MGDLKTQNTSYPAVKDTATLFADLTDDIVAQNHNGPNTAIVAIENELGIGLKGTKADLATRLMVNVGTDGGIVKATADPASPGTPAFYYNTVTNKLKIFNISTGQWDEFTTAVGLASYVRTDIPNTITAVHTFGATTDTSAPFIVASATSATVTNLDAGKVGGQARVLTINADHTHTATGAMGGKIDHLTALNNTGSNTHAQIDTFISTKAAASGLASLDSNSLVVQQPAVHTHTSTTTGGVVSHTSLTNIGTNTHAQIDTFIGNTTTWVDYSTSSTIVGWSSRSTTYLKYILIGKLAIISVKLIGTSNSVSVSFTMPFTFAVDIDEAVGISIDNGVTMTSPTYAAGNPGGNTITLYKDFTTANWTATGTKSCMVHIIAPIQ